MVTLQQQFKAALEARGKEVVGRSTHYLIMSRATSPDSFYYLGASGALRVGFSLSRNWPVKESFRVALLKEWKAMEVDFLAKLTPGNHRKGKEPYVL